MPGEKRSRDRVKVIDHYIRTEYPSNGPEGIAEKLGEPMKYITQRAHYLKVRMIKKPAPPKKPGQKTRANLMQEIRELKARNKELRLEIIKLTDRKRRAG